MLPKVYFYPPHHAIAAFLPLKEFHLNVHSDFNVGMWCNILLKQGDDEGVIALFLQDCGINQFVFILTSHNQSL